MICKNYPTLTFASLCCLFGCSSEAALGVAELPAPAPASAPSLCLRLPARR
jgi:hypothetical protein